ncbi:MAG: hypothetical protein HGGPFJEG_01512 [Ignavibacteria bacterium]|nr:hypothetical protein [Ignavibacteria bacterium]
MLKYVLALILFANISLKQDLQAQVTEAVIGVDGFTCSLCAKGVEGQFKALDYVKSVKTDLKKTQFTLIFKNNPEVKFKEIRDAVTDGGFSLREIDITAKGQLKTDGSSFFLLDTKNSPEINLKGVKGDFINGEKVLVKGKFDTPGNTLIVSSIEKL